MTTVVTIPGIMSDARTWRNVVGAMQTGDAPVHLADTWHDPTIEEMAKRALSETRGDLIILAHSMGARVALEMSHQAPSRIRGMVFANANFDDLGEHEEAHREARIAEANLDMAAYALGWVPKVISSASRLKPDLVASISRMVEDCPAIVQERQNRALIARPSTAPFLREVTAPVLLVTGSEDRISTVAVNEATAKLLSDAEVAVIDDAAHLLPFEQPQKLVAVISQWFAQKNIRLV